MGERVVFNPNLMKMKLRSLVFLGLTVLFACESGPAENNIDYPIAPVDFTAVKLQDGFWKSWVSTAVHETIPFAFQKCEETGRINNFIFAGDSKRVSMRASTDSTTQTSTRSWKGLPTALCWMRILN